jgi:hypothetical protein
VIFDISYQMGRSIVGSTVHNYIQVLGSENETN